MIYEILHSKQLERLKRFIGLKSGIYLKLKRFTPSASEPLRTTTIIKHNKIDCVIDVGANTGQFAESLYDFGYENRVISFEPVQACHDQLVERSKKHPNWTVAEKCAIGEKNHTTQINICGDSVFSSILQIQDWHAKLTAKSRIVEQEEVNVFSLDSILPKYIESTEGLNILLKVDTQGYEKQVLDGAKELLKTVIGLKIEIPLTPIYKDVEYTFFDTIDFMKENGFQPYSFNNEGVNLKTGRVNTIDALFLREREMM